MVKVSPSPHNGDEQRETQMSNPKTTSRPPRHSIFGVRVRFSPKQNAQLRKLAAHSGMTIRRQAEALIRQRLAMGM
jgi:hypothetical protein